MKSVDGRVMLLVPARFCGGVHGLTADGFAIQIRRLQALRLSDKDGFEEYATELGLWPQVGAISAGRVSAWYRRNPAMLDEWAPFVEPYEPVQFRTSGPEQAEAT